MSQIQLCTGRLFDFLAPTELTLEEVSYALSNLCRFTGHCRPFYSVAQHAVHVSRLVAPELAMPALHHDDVEAVVGDVSSPLKSLLPEYRKIERECERVILAGFGIDFDSLPHDELKRADKAALRMEQRALMGGMGWAGASRVMADVRPTARLGRPLPPEEARELFVARHFELRQLALAY